MSVQQDQGPCSDCAHPFSEHASDVNIPNAQRCFHGAATGDGCRPLYADRCKQYVPPKS